MANFYHRADQNLFNEAFGGLSAADAALLITGRQDLTDNQAEVLRLAEGNGGYRLRFDPAQVGHLAFCPVGTRGTGNSGWHRLVPASDECRRVVNKIRRSDFAARISAPRKTADFLFSLVRGYEPALCAAEAAWPYLIACPSMSDKALLDAGFRPGHPIDGQAIQAVRKILNVRN